MPINYISEYTNGCEEEATLDLCNKFVNSHHVNNIIMYLDETSEEEFVTITFQHYVEFYEAVFNVRTQVGSLYLLDYYAGDVGSDEPSEEYVDELLPLLPFQQEVGDMEQEGGEQGVQQVYRGIITVDKLLVLLGKLPHVMDYVEEEGDGVLH